MGLFSSLWTPETATKTGLTLAAAGAASLALRAAGLAGAGGAGGDAAISTGERQLLRQFFGQGVKGAEQRAANFEIPEGLGRQTLEKYAQVARSAIEKGIDKTGVQAARLKLIERALEHLDQ